MVRNIKTALKQRKDYETRHGTHIPYDDLKKMKRLNDMITYYQKQYNIDLSHRRIKIGSLKGDYSKLMAKLDLDLGFIRYTRATQGRPTRARKIKLKMLEDYPDFSDIFIRFEKTIKTPDILTKQIKMFENIGSIFSVTKLATLYDNFLKALDNNFLQLTFNGVSINPLLNRVKKELNLLSPYELYRVIKDHEDIILFMYNKHESPSVRLSSMLESITNVTGREISLTDGEVDILTHFGMVERTY